MVLDILLNAVLNASVFVCYLCYSQSAHGLGFRANKIKILEYLHGAWTNDRRVEWSIWMVYSKVEMPHHYIRSRDDEGLSQGRHGEVSVMRRLTDDVICIYIQSWHAVYFTMIFKRIFCWYSLLNYD